MRFTLAPIAMIAVAICSCAAFAQTVTSTQTATGRALAIVDGKPILDDELAPLVEGPLRELQFEEYQIRRKALNDLIDQKLLAAKANEKGLTSEEFLRQHVDARAGEPTEAEIVAYYASQKNLSNVPFARVKAQLLAGVKQQKVQRARQDFVLRLREEAKVSVMLLPPRVEVSFDPARVLGKADAPITIVEFADFQCPFCRSVHSTLQQLINKYPDRVRLAFRDFPLTDTHSRAQGAAEAARCAGQQGKFWPYHDLMFESSPGLSDKDLNQHARTLGLDLARFDSCLQSPEVKAQIQQDVQEGMRAGVSATPGFFINGLFLSGAQPLPNFEEVVEQELVLLKNHSNQPK